MPSNGVIYSFNDRRCSIRKQESPKGQRMSHGGTLLFFIALLPFVGALVPGIMIRAGRNACATFTAVPTAMALVMLITTGRGSPWKAG